MKYNTNIRCYTKYLYTFTGPDGSFNIELRIGRKVIEIRIF